MLSLKKPPKRAAAKARLVEAEEYFANQWLMNATFVNKTYVNKQFGRGQANLAMAKYFLLENRGSNISGKLTEIRPRDIDTLPEDRQTYLLTNAIQQKVDVEIGNILPDPPTDYDHKSLICVIKENLQQALDWCVQRKKFQYIKPVRIIMSKRFWHIYYREKSNRYYAMWPFCLTTWPSSLRKLILSGVDIDLENAIGQFIAEKLGPDLDNYPAAKFYLDNPKVIRNQLKEALGVSDKQAKQTLHATLNGASSLPSAIVRKSSSLLQFMTEEQALIYVSKYKTLISELSHIRKKIAPNNKLFMKAYREWEQQKVGTLFNGTGLIMHDGVDGVAMSTLIPTQMMKSVQISEARSCWDEEPIADLLITM